MNFTKKIAAAFLALTLTAGSLAVYAAKGTTPGYKMVNTYDEETGVITSDIYVTGGRGGVGQLGLYYDTELLDLAATISGEVTSDYDISGLNITSFVKSALSAVVPTAESNRVSNLVNEEDGEFYFAWYANGAYYVEAEDEDVKILTIKFVTADGVEVEDLEDAGTDLIKFASDTPSNTSIKGYKSGVYCGNEETEAFRNSDNAKNRIYLSVAFEGLDIEDETETVIINVTYADGTPVEGAFVKIGSEENQTNAKGEVAFEVSGEDYAVYYKLSESDDYMTLEDGTDAIISAPEKMDTPSVSAGKEKLTVTWTKPEMTGGSNITGYVVSYTEKNGTEQTETINDASTTRLALEGLTGGVEYTIKVKAVNAIGEGEYSDEKTATPTSGSNGGGGGGGGAAETPSEPLNYVVTYQVGANGTMISGSKTEKVKDGEKPTNVPTVKANEGYEFIGWATNDGTAVDPTTVEIKSTTTFYAQYKSTVVVNPFVDIKEEEWYYESVTEAYARGLMKGTSESEFNPNGNVTRAMFVTVLYRMAGEPANNGNEKFTDVEAGSWYDKAVAWASANGIVNGVSPTEFAPNNNITREQMAAMVYRYASYTNADMTTLADVSAYEDYSAVSPYAVEAMKWVCGRGIINGMSPTTLVPGGISIRAQAAAVFVRTQDALTK